MEGVGMNKDIKSGIDNDEAIRFVDTLRTIKLRPAMYFGKDYGYKQLSAFIYGYLLESKSMEQHKESTVSKIHNETNHKLFIEYE